MSKFALQDVHKNISLGKQSVFFQKLMLAFGKHALQILMQLFLLSILFILSTFLFDRLLLFRLEASTLGTVLLNSILALLSVVAFLLTIGQAYELLNSLIIVVKDAFLQFEKEIVQRVSDSFAQQTIIELARFEYFVDDFSTPQEFLEYLNNTESQDISTKTPLSMFSDSLADIREYIEKKAYGKLLVQTELRQGSLEAVITISSKLLEIYQYAALFKDFNESIPILKDTIESALRQISTRYRRMTGRTVQIERNERVDSISPIARKFELNTSANTEPRANIPAQPPMNISNNLSALPQNGNFNLNINWPEQKKVNWGTLGIFLVFWDLSIFMLSFDALSGNAYRHCVLLVNSNTCYRYTSYLWLTLSRYLMAIGDIFHDLGSTLFP